MNTCSKCQGPMESGLVTDFTYGGILQSTWAEGEPVKGFFGIKPKNKRPITTFRCTKCGYLESFAR